MCTEIEETVPVFRLRTDKGLTSHRIVTENKKDWSFLKITLVQRMMGEVD